MLITRHDPTPSEPLTEFTQGIARPTPLVDASASAELRVMLVRFEDGGRNLFHTHGFDQGLFILDGEGIVADEREEHRVGPGDFVLVSAGERHWHGAAPGQTMSHLAVGIPGTSDFDGVAYTATD